MDILGIDIYLTSHPTFMQSVSILFFFQFEFAIDCMIMYAVVLANEALQKLKWSKKSQSIVISGVTGSGKTVSAKHILEFLCRDQDNVGDAGPILESFGNATTRGNVNSSRFWKHIEVLHYKQKNTF